MKWRMFFSNDSLFIESDEGHQIVLACDYDQASHLQAMVMKHLIQAIRLMNSEEDHVTSVFDSIEFTELRRKRGML